MPNLAPISLGIWLQGPPNFHLRPFLHGCVHTKNLDRTFSPPGGMQCPSPTKVGTVTEVVRVILATRHVRIQCIVSPLGDAEILA